MPERWYAHVPVERWPAEVSADPRRFVALYQAFIRAELDAFADCELSEWDRKLGAMFHAIDPDEQLRGENELELDAHGWRELARWCWAPGWYLWSQDEDLALMNDSSVIPLLGEAAHGCPKREYIYGIVEHFVRDAAHAAVWLERGRHPAPEAVQQAVVEALARAERVLALASADAEQLVRYCRRMSSYAQRRPVGADEARQRVLDLRRCHPAEHVPVELADEGDLWVARLDRADITKGKLYVNKHSGEMWARTVDEPARRGGRRRN